MGFFKKVVLKDKEMISFPGITDALWYGIVNIESAEIRVTTSIPSSAKETTTQKGFRIPTGDGDDDYPVFALDTEEWVDDSDPLRKSWGVCIPFYREFTTKVRETLVQENADGDVILSAYTLGFFRDQQEQLVAGKKITYVDDLDVEDQVFISDSNAYIGSDDAIVDIPLHSGKYRIYLIEDSVRNLELDNWLKEAYTAEEWETQNEDYDVVRSLILIHESKVGKLNKPIYPLDQSKVPEILERLKDKDVVNKTSEGPKSRRAVLGNLWICIWATRYLHATSWNIQGLTYPKEYAESFGEFFLEATADTTVPVDVDWCVEHRGIKKEKIKFPK